MCGIPLQAVKEQRMLAAGQHCYVRGFIANLLSFDAIRSITKQGMLFRYNNHAVVRRNAMVVE
jgi:hypothetical protein